MSRLHISETDLRNLISRCYAREMKSSAYACALNESRDRAETKRLQETAMRRTAKTVMRILRESVQGVSPQEVCGGVERGLADEIVYKFRLKSKNFSRPIENAFDCNIEYEFGDGYILYAGVQATVSYNPTMVFGKMVDQENAIKCEIIPTELIIADKWGRLVEDPNLTRINYRRVKSLVNKSLLQNLTLDSKKKNRTMLPKNAQQRSFDYVPRYNEQSKFGQVKY